MKTSRRRFLGQSAAWAAGSIATLSAAPAFAKRLAHAAGARVAPKPAADLGALALSRFSYGATPESRARFAGGGRDDAARLRAWLEVQLHPGKIGDAVCAGRLKALELETLDKTLPELWEEHALDAKEIKKAAKIAAAAKPVAGAKGEAPSEKALRREARDLNQLPALEVEMAAWTRAVSSERQLFETMVEFWHDHFNVDAYDGRNIPPIYPHYDRDVIRAHALGNFREMIEAVAKSPAMLFYLDGFVSQSGNPNENYARELLELHTLGAERYVGVADRAGVPGFAAGQPEGYVDGDVYETARCFTGWRVDTGAKSADAGQFVYLDQLHDRFQKIVLGKPLSELAPPMKDAQRALDILCFHPATADHVARKLCRRYVADQPPARLVKAAAAEFRQSRSAPDQIARVLRLIALSPEFAASSGQKTKRPFEHAVSLLRATGAGFEPEKRFLNQYNQSGQRRFGWRTPDGYPDLRERWSSTSVWMSRWRLSNQIAHGHLDGVEFDAGAFAASLGVAPTSRALAEALGRRLTGAPLPAAEAHEVAEALAQGAPHEQALADSAIKARAADAVALIAMAPTFQKR